jgi:hypothetical protein
LSAFRAVERLAEERLGGDGLDARVKGREQQFLERLRPPERDPQAHPLQLALVVGRNDDIGRIGRTELQSG